MKENIIQSLAIMGKGMLAIFIVVGIIILATVAVNYFDNSTKKKEVANYFKNKIKKKEVVNNLDNEIKKEEDTIQ